MASERKDGPGLRTLRQGGRTPGPLGEGAPRRVVLRCKPCALHKHLPLSV